MGVFYFVGFYIMLVSLMLATTGGKPWSALSGRIMLLAHALLLISPALSVTGLIATKYEVCRPLKQYIFTVGSSSPSAL